eukprot:TRINITY_DN59410_c0_g1_i1.p1 TRINITY_DN59410_c0_g1~~TRINITY_DN59410_c0_g1_i1.p1  ORF type:complete len:386 (-),score=37.18 TRINITY_DN59410_c0_g1_i1:16-1173(-)
MAVSFSCLRDNNLLKITLVVAAVWWITPVWSINSKQWAISPSSTEAAEISASGSQTLLRQENRHALHARNDGMSTSASLPASAAVSYERLGEDKDIETLWQKPEGRIRGILFFAHGCSHQAPDLFINSDANGNQFRHCAQSNVGQCYGLPEEVMLQSTARSKGYVIAAMSGGTGQRSCWHMDSDPPRAKLALEHIRHVEGLDGVPLILIGGSSGGAFLGELFPSQHLSRVSCIVPMISAMRISDDFPRDVKVVFLHMARDKRTAKAIARNIAKLTSLGVRVREIAVEPHVVDADFLQRHGYGLSMKAATDAVAAFRSAGLLDEGGFLKQDPRRSNWRGVVQDLTDEVGGLEPNQTKLSELLNVAYAQHECIGDHMEEIIDFCEGP